MNSVKKTEGLQELVSAISDLTSCIDAMRFAHGDNAIAQSILKRHAKTIERARRISLRAPCPVCEDRACETNSGECGK